jgi:hypothetical protein
MADAGVFEEIKANIAVARKRPLAFGLCLGKKPETTILINHKTKEPDALGRQAKKDGETNKFVCGMMSVEGKNLNLSCVGDIPTGIARKTKEMLKLAGLKFKVRVLDPSGNPVEEDGDEEDEEGALPEGAAEDNPDRAKWVEGKAAAAEAIDAAKGRKVDVAPAEAALAKASETAEGEDYAAAAKAAEEVVKQVATLVAQAEQAGAERAKWEEGAARLQPMVQAMAAQGGPAAQKVAAVWSFAQSKVQGDKPDYAAAVKSLAMIAKLIEAAGVTAAPGSVEAPEATAPVAEPAMAGGGGGGGGGAPAAPPAGGPAPAPAAGPAAGPAAAPAAGPAAGPSATPAAAPKVDLTGTDKEKFDRAEALLKDLDAKIAAYGALIPGSAEPSPPAWATERTRIDDILKPMRAPGAALDAKKLDDALKALDKLLGTIAAQSKAKADWKRALDLFTARMGPIEAHPQKADPAVKPRVDALKADLAKAVALADKADFKGAQAALAPLGKKADEVEAALDAHAHYTTILAQREACVNPRVLGSVGDKAVDDIQRAMADLLTKAKADAAAGKYADAIKKLDQIPPLFDKGQTTDKRAKDYAWFETEYATLIALIDGQPAPVRALMAADIAKAKTDWANAKFAKTKDYAKSCQLMTPIHAKLSFLNTELATAATYQADLATVEAQLATFKAHAGAAGITAFIQAMERDVTQAKTEAANTKFSTADALLVRSMPDWPTATQNANDYQAYVTKRDAAKAALDAERPKPPAASAVAQGDALLQQAATKSTAGDQTGALALATEAEKRAADAKAAADAADQLGGLKDAGALAGIAADYAKAKKVFTDMKANVAGKDSTGTFAGLLATADTEAAKADTAAAANDFAAARTALDAAIKIVEDTLPKVMAKVPFDQHLAALKTKVAAVVPLNLDNGLKPALDKINPLVTEAETLAKAPGFDFAAAEVKVTEATKLADQALADGALLPQIKADKATVVSMKTTINTVTAPTVAAEMTRWIARIDKFVADIDAAVAAADFRTAAAKAAEGAALQGALTTDINKLRQLKVNKTAWIDTKIAGLTGPGKEPAKPHVDRCNAILADYAKAIADGNFDSAAKLVNDAGLAIDAGTAAMAASGTYETARTAADGALAPLKAMRNPGIETALQALEKAYADAQAQAAAGTYRPAEAAMKEIPAKCPPLVAAATAYAQYDGLKTAAQTALDGLKGNAQAAAIQPAIDRLQAKFDAAVKLAEGTKFAEAGAQMAEIPAMAAEAKKQADQAAKTGADADAIAGGGVDAAALAKAKALFDGLMARPENGAAQTELQEAQTQLATASTPGADPAAAKAALTACMDACKAAEAKMTAAAAIGETVKEAERRLTELKAHAQAAYVAPDVQKAEKELADAKASVASGGDAGHAAANLNTTMADLANLKILAEAQAEYLAFRAKPEVEARLPVLEAHPHRYAIKAQIDTVRQKLQQAADASGAKKPQDALKLVTEVKDIAQSAFVMAEMRANRPPSVADVKEILARPGGATELDAMVDELEPDAQRAVLRVCFEARYGCTLEVWLNANRTTPNPDGTQTGPDIKRFYQLLSDLPGGDVVANDSMREFEIIEAAGQGSFYSGGKKEVVMHEGAAVQSSAYTFGSEHEVGGADPECQPADQKEVSFFSWNTLHEVGHAVDDKHKFMDGKMGNAAFGGWQHYAGNVKPIADKVAAKFQYDATYIGQLMMGNANPPMPSVPEGAGAPTPEEWEGRRLKVVDWVSMASVNSNPWASNAQAAKIAIDGIVYHESYALTWNSYPLSARKQGMTGYQFRAPGEWFAELYAAFHSQKLKSGHPARAWLETL